MVDSPNPNQINPTAVRVYTSNPPGVGPSINVQLVGTPYTATFSSPLLATEPGVDETFELPVQGN